MENIVLDTPDRISEEPKMDVLVSYKDRTSFSLVRINWLDMAKLWTPHLALIFITFFYIIFGALVFQNLEKDHFMRVVNEEKASIQRRKDKYLDHLWEIAQQQDDTRHSFELETNDDFLDYVDTVYSTFRTTKLHIKSDESTIWDFRTALFFTTSLLTSIGYGFIVPTSFFGRLFCVIYCLIGLPLTLLTVANIAKFCSELLYYLHRRYHRLRLYLRKRWYLAKNKGETEYMFNLDDIEENIEKIKLFRFPVLFVFVVVIGYGMCGVYLLGKWEGWTPTEALYFSLISIFTIGFGDLKLDHRNYMRCLVYVVFGVIMTTMCMDILASMYLEEIHFLGRQIQTKNPFYLLREAKMRKRRAAMAGLLAQLARGLALKPPPSQNNTEDWVKKREKKKKKRKHRIRRSTCAEAHNFFQRFPPDSPSDCLVISTSAYSARLAWCAAYPKVGVTYNVRCKLKHDRKSEALCVNNIASCAYEITGLKSCSLYEFTITAVNKFGTSPPVTLVQYTEFELSPQHIVIEKLSANCIRLSWEPPFKRFIRVGIMEYVIYHTDNTKASLDEWKKVPIDNSQSVVFPGLKYDTYYMFSVRAVFKDNTPSPLSRASLVKTDKIEFNQRCIGLSKTLEFMEGLTEKKECSDHSPLLARDYCYNTL